MTAHPLLVLIPFLFSCAAASTQEPAKPLVVASDLDNPPFAWVDDQGTPCGRDVAMMSFIAHDLDRELVWIRLPFAELLPAVERGEVDVVCATLGYTEERARRVLFSNPYFVTALAVVVRDTEGAPRSVAELAGRRVTAAAGTTSQQALRSRPAVIGVFPEEKAEGNAEGKAEGKADEKAGAEPRTTLERLLAGEVDGAVMDGPAADAMVRDHPGRLRRLDEDLGEELYSLAIAPGHESLVRAIDAALERLAGDLRALDEQYGLEQVER